MRRGAGGWRSAAWQVAYPDAINEAPALNGYEAPWPHYAWHLPEHDKNVSRPLKQGAGFRSPARVEMLKAADIGSKYAITTKRSPS